MEELLRYLVLPLLSAPDQLQITLNANQIVMKVDDADVGRVIGKHGNVINALRTLLRTYCSTHKLQFVNLSVDTPVKKD